MLTIHKYPLQLTELQSISVPSPAKIIHLALQSTGLGTMEREVPTIWAEVETTPPSGEEASHMKRINIQMVGTGHPVPKNARHIGTVIMVGYVWHFYQLLT
jgi:hypothetical protein